MKDKTISARYQALDAKKSTIISRCEQYAAWTLPHIFPKDGQGDEEQSLGFSSVGAEAVNSLSNTVVTALFRPQSPFFRQEVDAEVYKDLEAVPEGTEEYMSRVDFDNAMRQSERKAIQRLDKKELRVTATITAKLLIITGNALKYYGKKDQPLQVYDLRNYCVRRGKSGEVLEIIIYEYVSWDTIPEKHKQFAIAGGYTRVDGKDDEIKLYTKVWKEGKRWKVQQAIDIVDLPPDGDYTDKTIPWKVLTWNRNPKDTYGRGLVEDYANDFNALHMAAQAETEGQALMTEKRFGVEPGSGFDIVKLNNSEPGSFHMGRKDSIFEISLGNHADFQVLLASIQVREKRIQRAFLMKLAIQRDAERVTAEELRLMANALEESHGGIYSKLATEWQLPLAHWALQDVGFTPDSSIEPKIISGMDSLSRAGDMDNFNWMLDDLARLANVHETFIGEFDPEKVLRFIANNRAVDITAVLKSKEQKRADMQAAQDEHLAQQANEQAISSGGKIAEKLVTE